MRDRPELNESDVDLVNRQISGKAARNALLPSLALVGFYGGSGLAGPLNPIYNLPTPNSSNVPTDYSGALQNAFNNSSPDYYIGLSLNIPLRNRVAKADQYRSELEYRQAELRREQLKKQIRIEVRNAQYALEQTGARVGAARKARDLAQRTFEIMQKEQTLGAGSTFQTMTAQRDLSIAELDMVTAMTTYEKAKVELDRATGSTLEHNGIRVQDAENGTIATSESLAMPSPTKTGEVAVSERLEQGQANRPRILAADDQQHILEAIELLLKPQGYEVDVARSPELVREALVQFFLRRGTDRPELHAGHDVRTGRPGPAFGYCRHRQHASGHRHDGVGQCGTGGRGDAARRAGFHSETVGERAAACHSANAGRTASRVATGGTAGGGEPPAERAGPSRVHCRRRRR